MFPSANLRTRQSVWSGLLRSSPLTAKTHANRAMMKLNARDRAQLVVLAYKTGLVRPGERPAP